MNSQDTTLLIQRDLEGQLYMVGEVAFLDDAGRLDLAGWVSLLQDILAEMVLADEATARCRGCARQIIWVTLAKGRPLPVDAGLQLVVTSTGEYVRGHTPHWASCPQANRFRKTGG